MQRDINCAVDEDRHVRKAAVKALHVALFGGLAPSDSQPIKDAAVTKVGPAGDRDWGRLGEIEAAKRAGYARARRRVTWALIIYSVARVFHDGCRTLITTMAVH